MQIQIPDARIGNFGIQKGKSNVTTSIFLQCTDIYVQITTKKNMKFVLHLVIFIHLIFLWFSEPPCEGRWLHRRAIPSCITVADKQVMQREKWEWKREKIAPLFSPPLRLYLLLIYYLSFCHPPVRDTVKTLYRNNIHIGIKKLF